MKPLMTSSLAALAGAVLAAGCAVAPVQGPYAYGYDRYDYYSRPYYYGGPVYYDTWPGYYYGPGIVGTFRFDGRDRDRHWGGGSWRHNSLTTNSDQTRPRAFRSSRSSTARNHAGDRVRDGRHVQRRESDKS
jgi:hypothetical protein